MKDYSRKREVSRWINFVLFITIFHGTLSANSQPNSLDGALGAVHLSLTPKTLQENSSFSLGANEEIEREKGMVVQSKPLFSPIASFEIQGEICFVDVPEGIKANGGNKTIVADEGERGFKNKYFSHPGIFQQVEEIALKERAN